MDYKPKKPPCLACFLGRIAGIGTAWEVAGRLAAGLGSTGPAETAMPLIGQGYLVYKVRRRKDGAAPLLH